MRRARQLLSAGADAYRTSQSRLMPGVSSGVQLLEYPTTGHPLAGPWPAGSRAALFCAGDFWAAEDRFLRSNRIECSVAGFAGGSPDFPKPSFEEVCRGDAEGYREAVKVVYNSRRTSYSDLLWLFWTSHSARHLEKGRAAQQGRQLGSVIFAFGPRQLALAQASKAFVDDRLSAVQPTLILDAAACPFYAADAHHQQRLARDRAQGRPALPGLRAVRAALPRDAFLAHLSALPEAKEALRDEEAPAEEVAVTL
ncbi:Peptide methionine sulfoxide reductase MsrA [Diplonema papillatum]|nr:Peptide methionine sulfoxide reductase MsrA [Diplonema papillatum]